MNEPAELFSRLPENRFPSRFPRSLFDTLTPDKTKQAYGTALQDFFAWTAGSRLERGVAISAAYRDTRRLQ